MQLLVRFKSFGPIRRILGQQMIELNVPEDSTVLQVIEQVIELGGEPLRNMVIENGKIDGNLIIMLNKRDVTTLGGVDVIVKAGDELALLPHVQGG
ncbi:MAG: MoaD/ThiS family protein [Candidatus Thorarchaeota archaeon]